MTSNARLAALALSLGTLASAAGGDTYENADFGLRLDPPAGWTLAVTAAGGEQLELLLAPGDAADRVQLKLRVDPSGVARDPQLAVEAALASVASDPSHSHGRSERRRVAGHEAAGLAIDVASAGRTWRVRQAYLVENDFVYLLQDATLVDEHDARVASCDAVWEGLSFVAPSAETSERRRVRALAARCGSEVDWADDWEDAARRARRERKPIVATLRRYPGFSISDDRMSGFFMEEDVLALLAERFVPLRVDDPTAVPFASPKVYGMGPFTFGTALLVLSPDGRVLLDAFVHDEEVLRLGLQVDPRLPGPPAPVCDDPLEQARAHARRGELALAERALDLVLEVDGDLAARGVASDAARRALDAWRLRASLAARARDGAGALAALGRARACVDRLPEGEREVAGFELLLDGLPVLTGTGRVGDALRALDAALADPPDSPRLGEALFVRGVAALLVESSAAARPWLERLVDDPARSEDRWAWKAAAVLTGTAFAADRRGDPSWPDARQAALLRPPTYAALDPSRVTAAARDALAFLLAAQEEDGSWPQVSEIGRASDDAPDDFELSVTALAVRALLPWHERPEVARAIERGTAWLVAGYERAADEAPPPLFMDYGVWSRPCVLFALADLLALGLVERATAERLAARIVDELAKREKPDGGWSYYVTGDLASAPATLRTSMTFTTAFAVLALLRAREAQLPTSDGLVGRGLDALLAARADDGSFAYMSGPAAPAPLGASGAAGRGPVCALALLRGGRGTSDDLSRALAAFVEHRDAYAAETGKALMHTGAQGEGSHWLLFDDAQAALAAAALGERGVRQAKRTILELVLRARTSDGAFVDNPLLGPAFGAAMALTVFERLGVEL